MQSTNNVMFPGSKWKFSVHLRSNSVLNQQSLTNTSRSVHMAIQARPNSRSQTNTLFCRLLDHSICLSARVIAKTEDTKVTSPRLNGATPTYWDLVLQQRQLLLPTYSQVLGRVSVPACSIHNVEMACERQEVEYPG